MKKFNVKPLGAIISGLAMAAASQSLMAQTTDTNTENPEVEEVVVTGFARSIQNAIDVKRNADTVVQAISADDIGGLPDVSIADSLSRVPGITVTREGGQAGRIQVRGMGGDFVFATLNGREQVSPNGSRAMEYSQFPSELINSVQVYMSPKSSLIEGGVSGSVELTTANALKMTEDMKFNASARASYNDQASDVYGAEPLGGRLSFAFQKKLMDDTLGVSLGAAFLRQSKSTQRFEHFGFEADGLENNTQIVDEDFKPVSGDASRPATIFVSTGFEAFQTGGEDKRDGYVAAVTYEPSENFKAQADAFYSKFDSTGFSRGYRISNFGGADAAKVVLGQYGEVLGGEFLVADNAPGAFNLQMNFTDKAPESELFASGLNLEWTVDNLILSVDLSHSDASGYNDDKNVEMHQYADTPDGEPVSREPNQAVSYLLDGINVPSFTLSTVPKNSYGHWYDEEGVSDWRISKYGHYPRINDDVLDAVRFDLKLELELPLISSVEGGVRYSERNHTDSRKVFVYGDSVPGLKDEPLKITDQYSEIVRFKGELSNFPSFLSVDADAILQNAYDNGLVLGFVPEESFENPNPVASPRSIKPAARWGEGKAWSMQQASDIDENVASVYAQANISTTLFDKDLTGNIGIRHVETDQSSVALVNVNGDVNAGAVAIYDDLGEANSEYAYQRLGTKYSNTLPSLNLNYRVTDADQIRFAAARVMSRAPINRLAASTNQGDISVVDGVPTFSYGTNTSPYLKPFVADQFDLSYEHYMEETNGTAGIAGYYRDIKSFIQGITYEKFDFAGAGFDVPDTYIVNDATTGFLDDARDVVNGDFSTAVNNDDGGYIQGVELMYTQTFNFLPDLFAGLGVQASVSFVDSKITIANTTNAQAVSGDRLPFPGLVERSANFTVFYSLENFETRLSTNFQDEYVGEVRNIELNSVYFAPEVVMDYQATYKFDMGVDVVFSVGNLTNEPNRSYIAEEKYTRLLQWFGRTYNLGVNYTF